MLNGATAYADAMHKVEFGQGKSERLLLLHRSAVGIQEECALNEYKPIRLVLTSPPYPGVHVLYHRWQVQGRRETPAPFWITSCVDGQGASYYTFGDRHAEQLRSYFEHAQAAFQSIAAISSTETLVVQLVAFSDPSWQLKRYTEMMRNAGFREVKFPKLANNRDGRVWRSVPNRKWYAWNASERGRTHSSSEVVLFHKLR
jgi:hypothetical protein